MKIQQQELINELIELTKSTKHSLQELQQLPIEQLNIKQDKNQWSALECIEHLNLYGDFYLPELKKRLKNASQNRNGHFKSGLIGNYFVKIIKADSKKKMKTASEMNAIGSKLTKATLERFSRQLNELEEILEQSKPLDLTRTKTAISLTKLIQLRMGDTLRFVVHHNDRHMKQARRALQN